MSLKMISFKLEDRHFLDEDFLKRRLLQVVKAMKNQSDTGETYLFFTDKQFEVGKVVEKDERA